MKSDEHTKVRRLSDNQILSCIYQNVSSVKFFLNICVFLLYVNFSYMA